MYYPWEVKNRNSWDKRGKKVYKGGSIFHNSSFTFIQTNHQVSLKTVYTLRGKHNFFESVGIRIYNYRADNTVFNSQEYLDSCEE